MKIAIAAALLLPFAALAADAGVAPRTDARATTVIGGQDWESLRKSLQEVATEVPATARLEAACSAGVAALPATAQSPEIADACFAGIGASGDPFVFYMSKSARTALFGPASAIGVVLEPDPDRAGAFAVRSVGRGSPARESGLRKGDAIVAIDGRSTAGMTGDDAIHLLRGDSGTRVSLSVRRGVEPDTRELTVTRLPQVADHPRADMPAAGILYLGVPAVGPRAISLLLADASREFGRDGQATPRGLVLDLRGNEGGSVSDLQRLAGCLLPPGTPLMITRGRDGSQTLAVQALEPPDGPAPPPALDRFLRRAPLVVLVDHRTGSGAEALAMALRERRGALIHGEPTAGKATTDQLTMLISGGVFRIHVGEILSSKGAPLNKVGVPVDGVAPTARDVEFGDPERDTGLKSAVAALDRR